MSSTRRRVSRATDAHRRAGPGAGARTGAVVGRRRRLRLAVLMALMVALPISAVAWLGLRSARYERERARLRLVDAADSALDGVTSAIRARVEADMAELEAVLTDVPDEPADLRRIGRAERLVRQVFLVDAHGDLVYPKDAAEASGREREFLIRTQGLWDQGLFAGGDPTEDRGAPADGGTWRSWVWGAGVSYLYWLRGPDGAVRGVEVEGAALLADVIAALPETAAGNDAGAGTEGGAIRMTLQGMDGAVLYQWGRYEPAEGEAPLTGRRVEGPVPGWSLSYYAPTDPGGLGGGGSALAVILSVLTLGLVLAGAGVYVWRESMREAREAERRVSFVNHVSHELKTPLTNIRLYAELMEQRMSEGGEPLSEYLAVVVDESRRLSRLIHNVLSFSRRDRGALDVRPAPDVVDDVVRGVIDDFRPSLAEKGIAVEMSLSAPARVWVDADALEQILANLVSNVEKYAAEGRYVGVVARLSGETTELRVRDHGPGVAQGRRERVFEAFYRVSNRLTDGVAGTGIGLTIARELARLHGGDVLLTSPAAGEGAELVVTLHTPPCEEGA